MQVISTRELHRRVGEAGFANLCDPSLHNWMRSKNVSARDLLKYLDALKADPLLDDASVTGLAAQTRDAIREMLRDRDYLAL